MATYLVYNNTDLRDSPFVTHNRRKAEQLWRRIRPRADAGNLYRATFKVHCERCEGWQDATVEYETCDCANRP